MVAYYNSGTATGNGYTLTTGIASDSTYYNATNNTSTVYYSLTLSSNSSKSFNDRVYASMGNGTISMASINNEWRSLGTSSSVIVFDSSYTVTHKADGSATAYVDAYYYTAGQGSNYSVPFTTYQAATSITLYNAVRQPTTPTLTVTRPKSGTDATGTTINLSWTASTPPSGTASDGTGDKKSYIDWYEYRYSTDNATWTTYNANNANGLGTATTATFGPTVPLTVVPGTVYYFQVRAHATNSEGYGPWSSSVVAYAVPSITSVTSVGTTASVVVAPPSSTGGSTISSYTVQYSTDSGFAGTPGSVTTSGTTATITGLSPGRTYYFRARYLNAASVTSPYSATSSVFVSAYGRRYQTVAISGVSAIGANTTYTTSAAHGFSLGDTVSVTGITPSTLNGSGTISAISTSGTFSFTIPTSPSTSGSWSSGGTAAGWALMLTGQRYDANGTSPGVPGWVAITTAQKYTAGAWTPFS